MSLTAAYYRQQDELRRKKVVSNFCLGCGLANTIAVFPDIYYGLWITVGIGMLLTFFFVVMSLVNLHYHTNIAANILLLVGNLSVFLFSNITGESANTHFILLIGVLFVPFMLDVRNKYSVLFHTTLPFLLIFVLEIFDFGLLPNIIKITDEQKAIFGYFNILIMFFITPALVFSIIKTHTSLYDMLIKLGAEAEMKNIELAKTNAELDRFVYSVSHDLRSPIASILGLINLSRMEKDLTVLNHYEELKEKSLLKLDSFIRDILDYSRNSRTEIIPELVDWQHFITQGIEQHQHSEEAKNVQITFRITQNQDFYTDINRVRVIFNNLLSNAIRYRDKYKDKQTICIEIITKNDFTNIKFVDNGIGIEKEHIGKIFNMFYRANIDSKGSGLGLYIVAETIQKLNGQIIVDSQIGSGTTFSIKLPNQVVKLDG